MVIHVQDEVLAHDSQPNERDVCSEEATGGITFNVPGGIWLQPQHAISTIADILAMWSL